MTCKGVTLPFRTTFLLTLGIGLVPYGTMLIVHTLIVVFAPSLIVEGAILVTLTALAFAKMYDVYPQIFAKSIKSGSIFGVLFWLPIGISLLISLIIGYPLGVTPLGIVFTLFGMFLSLVVSSLVFQRVMHLERFPTWYILATLIPFLWFGGSVLTFGIRGITVTISSVMLLAFLVSSNMFVFLNPAITSN